MAHPTRIAPDHHSQQKAHSRSGSSSISILQHAKNVSMGDVNVSHQHGDLHDCRVSSVYNDHSTRSNTIVDQRNNGGYFFNGPIKGNIRRVSGLTMVNSMPPAGGKARRESAPATSAPPAGGSLPQQENPGETVRSSRDIIPNRARLSAQRFYQGHESSVIDQRWNQGTMFNEGCHGSFEDYQDYFEGYGTRVPEGSDGLIAARSSISQVGHPGSHHVPQSAPAEKDGRILDNEPMYTEPVGDNNRHGPPAKSRTPRRRVDRPLHGIATPPDSVDSSGGRFS